MTAAKHEITRDDILPMADYARERKGRRRALDDQRCSILAFLGGVQDD